VLGSERAEMLRRAYQRTTHRIPPSQQSTHLASQAETVEFDQGYQANPTQETGLVGVPKACQETLPFHNPPYSDAGSDVRT